jgi:YHS domain-containing protein
MPVAYEGKTYYVCCTGCKEAFLADPKAFLAKAEKK